MTERVEKLAADLQGTCKSLHEGCEACGIEEDSLTQDEHLELDNLVFCCDTCSWWCEISEQSEDSPDSCTDCQPDEED